MITDGGFSTGAALLTSGAGGMGVSTGSALGTTIRGSGSSSTGRALGTSWAHMKEGSAAHTTGSINRSGKAMKENTMVPGL